MTDKPKASKSGRWQFSLRGLFVVMTILATLFFSLASTGTFAAFFVVITLAGVFLRGRVQAIWAGYLIVYCGYFLITWFFLRLRGPGQFLPGVVFAYLGAYWADNYYSTRTDEHLTDRAKTKSRSFQFSLRTLMVVVTVFCIGFGWLGVQIKRARDQRQAVETIRRLGGTIIYHHQIGVHDPPGREWLRQLIGDEYFFSVEDVHIEETEVNDANLVAIKRLNKFYGLYLNNTHITDAGLEHLKGLTLSALMLDNTQITDAGLEHLKGLTNLTLLVLNNTQITDAGLEHLKELTKLPLLHLNNTKITDAGLEHLKGLTNLRMLYLGGTKITDAGLVHLRGLANLHTLDLSMTQITDAGLMHLRGLANLRKLSLNNTQVTDEGVKKLQQALPNCTINIQPNGQF